METGTEMASAVVETPTGENTNSSSVAGDKEKKKRTPVLSKENLLEALVPQLQNIFGARVSRTKAWDIFKTAFNVAFELGKDKPLSLSGVGRFFTFDSKRSVEKGKPARRMRFRPSSAVNDTLNAGGSFLAEIPVATEEASTEEAAPEVVEVPAPKGRGKAPKASKASPVAEVAPAMKSVDQEL